jgi:hypothetical protein
MSEATVSDFCDVNKLDSEFWIAFFWWILRNYAVLAILIAIILKTARNNPGYSILVNMAHPAMATYLLFETTLKMFNIPLDDIDEVTVHRDCHSLFVPFIIIDIILFIINYCMALAYSGLTTQYFLRAY